MRNATPLTIADGAVHVQPHGAGRRRVGGGTGGPGDIDKVTVTYTWTMMTPLLRMAFTGGQITLQVDSAMKNEARFQ